MKRVMIFGMIVIFLFSIASAATYSFDTIFSQFKSSLDKKDYLKALQSLRSSLELFWKQSPLILNNVRFVKSDGNSYGIYEPKEGEKFISGESIYLYMEPVGYALKKNPKGFYEFGFTADFSIEDKSGKVLGGQKNFANLDFKSWNFNTEVSLTFTYTFTGLGKGRYKIITHVKDKNSDKKATVENWFNII